MTITYDGTTISVTGGKDSGSATSGSTTTLVDSTKAWVSGAMVGRYVWINSGTGAGALGYISANTATTLTCEDGFWATDFAGFELVQHTPDATSGYLISHSFGDIAAEDTANGWGVFTQIGSTLFHSTARMQVSSGPSFLATSGETLEFDQSVSYVEIRVWSSCRFVLGRNIVFNKGSTINFQRYDGGGNSWDENKAHIYVYDSGHLDLFGNSTLRGLAKEGVVDTGYPMALQAGSYTTIAGGDGAYVTLDRIGQIRARSTNFYTDGMKKIKGAQFALIAGIPQFNNIMFIKCHTAFTGSSATPHAVYEIKGFVSLRSTSADVWIYSDVDMDLVNPVWDRGVLDKGTGTIRELYTFNVSVSDSVAAAVIGVRCYGKDSDGVEIFNATTDVVGVLPEQRIIYKRWIDNAVGYTYDATLFRFRKYGYVFLNEYSVVDSPVTTTKIISVNPYTIADEATVAAYTGITESDGLVSLSESHTLLEVYEHTQYWSAQSTGIPYDEILLASVNNTFTLPDSHTLAVTGGTLSGGTLSGGTLSVNLAANFSTVVKNSTLDFTESGTYDYSGKDFEGSIELTNSSGGAVTVQLDPTTTYVNTGPNITVEATATAVITFTGVPDGCEVRVFNKATGVEIDGIEDWTGGDSLTFNLDGGAVMATWRFIHVLYDVLAFDLITPTTDTEIPVSMRKSKIEEQAQ